MSKRIGTLAFLVALGVFAAAWLPGAAQAGPASICGDGTTEGNELCDDANTVATDTCSFPSCLPRVCGDNVLNADPGTDEECDDGNTAAGDGCAADCSCEVEVCGDGIQGCTEACDDSNTANGDGCSSTCQIETAEPQTKKQQNCINGINKNLAGVIKAQNGDNSSCIGLVAKGTQASTVGCLSLDLKGKVQKAKDKTTKTNTNKCTPPKGETATIAYTDPANVNDAGMSESLASTSLLFGGVPLGIVTKAADPDGAKCQAEVVKQHNAVQNKWISEANKAKKKALKGGKGNPPVPAPAASNTDVATAVDAGIVAARALGKSLNKAEVKAQSKIASKCTLANVNDLMDCNGATTVPELQTCVIAAAEAGACEALEAADGLALDCPTVPVIP